VIYSIEQSTESTKHTLKRINVNEKGEVDYWPHGVFSESFEEVKALGEAQLKLK